jgi:hypothetical protein
VVGVGNTWNSTNDPINYRLEPNPTGDADALRIGAEGANSARNRSGKRTVGVNPQCGFGLTLESGAREVPTDGAEARCAFKLSGFWTEGRYGFRVSGCHTAPLFLE